jgi:hypothetical protein
LACGFLGVTFVPLGTAASAPAQEKKKIEPPGYCSDKQYTELRGDEQGKCKYNYPSACTSSDSCAEIQNKKDGFQRCADARRTLSKQCFRDEDQGHAQAVASAEGAVKNCNTIYGEKVVDGQCGLPKDKCR